MADSPKARSRSIPAHFTITTDTILGDETCACTTDPAFASDVRPGDRVLLNDGAVTLRVLQIQGADVRLEVLSGGVTGNQKGINLPGVRVSAPSMSEKDRGDLHAGLAAGVDLLALSFVRRAQDVKDLRELMGDSKIPVIAKIEKPEALADIDAILKEANGIMVAPGDLAWRCRSTPFLPSRKC